MSTKRWGKLRRELLLQLHSRRSHTVTELAKRTGRHRSSVSRTLAVMKNDGLVARHLGYLVLTVDGDFAAFEVDEQIRREINEAKRYIGDLEAVLMRRDGCRRGRWEDDLPSIGVFDAMAKEVMGHDKAE